MDEKERTNPEAGTPAGGGEEIRKEGAAPAAGAAADSAGEKQQESKKYLVFYVIGLFSVALVLILLSYLTQVRADEQLANLNSQISQQASAVEGANARLQVLQETVTEQTRQLEEQEQTIAALREALGLDADAAAEEVIEAAGRLADQKQAMYLVMMAQDALAGHDTAGAKQYLDRAVEDYGLERLNGTGEDALLTAEAAGVFAEVYAAVYPAGKPVGDPVVPAAE